MSKFERNTYTLLLGLFSLVFFVFASSDSRLSTNNITVKFLCTSSFLDLEGINNSGNMIIDMERKTIKVVIPMKKFYFEKSSNYRALNEWFLDSRDYPKAKFEGRYVEDIDFEEDGEYKGYLRGNITLKEVTRNRIIPYTLTIKDGKITAESIFDASILEFKIETPAIFRHKISESVRISVKAVFD